MTSPFGTEPLGGLSPEELLLALEAAQAGTFRVDLRTGELRWSASLSALHGLSADAAPRSFEDFLALVHPDDRPELERAVRGTIEDGVPYSGEIRALWPDGSIHWLHGAGRRVDDAEGRPSALVGVARNIDAERAAHAAGEEMRALVDAVYATAPVGLAFVDRDMRYVRINEAVAHIDPDKVALARELQERYPPDRDAPTGAAKVTRTGESELYAELTPELLERAGVDAEQIDLIRSLGMTSAMVVPLRARDRVLGALTLIATEGRPNYGPDDLAFAEQIAARAAIAVDNARLYREAREQERRSAEARALL